MPSHAQLQRSEPRAVSSKSSERRELSAPQELGPDVTERAAALGNADDAALACALMARNPAAPRAAWNRFSPLVGSIVRRSVGPWHDTEDIVQDVFLRLFQRIHSLRNPIALKAFLVAITLRTIRYARRRQPAGSWPVAVSPDARVVNSDGNARRALIRFYDVLSRINERDRTAFVLRFVEGMDAAEVAAALDVSVPTARRCSNRAWNKVTLLAQRDPFLVDYLGNVPAVLSDEQLSAAAP
jgi:RNA polymerase sigma-70 factor (ECF subfamily)